MPAETSQRPSGSDQLERLWEALKARFLEEDNLLQRAVIQDLKIENNQLREENAQLRSVLETIQGSFSAAPSPLENYFCRDWHAALFFEGSQTDLSGLLAFQLHLLSTVEDQSLYEADTADAACQTPSVATLLSELNRAGMRQEDRREEDWRKCSFWEKPASMKAYLA